MQVAQRASEEIKKRHLPFYGLVLWHPGFPDLEFLLFLKFLIIIITILFVARFIEAIQKLDMALVKHLPPQKSGFG